jgi:hypothetical protein
MKTEKVSKPKGFINSFPRSGRTWVRYTLAQYFNMLYKMNMDIGFKTLGKVFSDVGAEDSRSEQYGMFPDIMFSHEHPRHSQRESQNVMIVRNVLDVMVSLFYHYDCNDHFDGKMYNTILLDKRFIDSYCSYMNKWFNNQKITLHVVQYERLHDPDEWCEMLEHLSYVAHVDMMIDAMSDSNFERMQQDELSNPQVMENWSSDPNHMRVRKGKIGGWKEKLTQHQADEIVKQIRKNLPDSVGHVLTIYRALPE